MLTRCFANLLAPAAACDVGIRALADTFSCLFPFSILAMTIVTVRVAWWQDSNSSAVTVLESPRSRVSQSAPIEADEASQTR